MDETGGGEITGFCEGIEWKILREWVIGIPPS